MELYVLFTFCSPNVSYSRVNFNQFWQNIWTISSFIDVPIKKYFILEWRKKDTFITFNTIKITNLRFYWIASRCCFPPPRSLHALTRSLSLTHTYTHIHTHTHTHTYTHTHSPTFSRFWRSDSALHNVRSNLLLAFEREFTLQQQQHQQQQQQQQQQQHCNKAQTHIESQKINKNKLLFSFKGCLLL